MLDKILPKLIFIEQKIKSLETHIAGMNRVYGAVKKPNSDKEIKENEDRGLKCAKCSTFLGFFDDEDQQFRFKYNELVIYLNPGDNGYITIVCNNCSYANNLGYITCENQI
tara:strand:- start:3112 stop:3444 length:333 start_codon:yes stop_codon:yes gene_type:complete